MPTDIFWFLAGMGIFALCGLCGLACLQRAETERGLAQLKIDRDSRANPPEEKP